MLEVKLNQDEEPNEALTHGAAAVKARTTPKVSPFYELKPLAVAAPVLQIVPQPNENGRAFQPKVPVITGEATVRGFLAVDGVVSGQLNAKGGTLSIRQRGLSAVLESQPEISGEVRFADMLRVNGHIAGRVIAPKGTLIVDSSARVDADIEVNIATINGRVNGDIVAYERVDVGPTAIVSGNIRTRSLTIKPGAVFEGISEMLNGKDF